MSRFAIAVALLACQGASSERSGGPVELVDAPPTHDIAAYVTAQLARRDATTVVYVGASWCEPCRRFHEAAAAHRLDAAFGGLRLLIFDLDRDEAALEAAGYRSELIPLFALPGPDGRASGEQFSGSIKGPGALDEIVPHLRALLGPSPASPRPSE